MTVGGTVADRTTSTNINSSSSVVGINITDPELRDKDITDPEIDDAVSSDYSDL
ncbi:hypothetical protein ACOSP6_06895 [Tenacibaculum sp. MEBiC06402]|uniref:hypothetical protein n=1 Tax=unclassified Tenacibaculum TaxID=2635139 RepID=UPI003B98E922